MYGISGKAVAGIAVGGVLLVIILVRTFFGGSPDVMSGDDSERIGAIRQVAVNGGSNVGDTMASVVTSKSSVKVRREAFGVMTHHLLPKHREIVRTCTKDPDPVIRTQAVEALGVYGDKSATTDLIEIVKKKAKEDETVLQPAIRALSKCDDPRSIVTLMNQAENGANNETKSLAMTKLLEKLNVRIARGRDPQDARGWRDLIQRWKESRRVREAYEKAGARLISRPQDKVGKDWHPERRGRR